MQSTWIILGRGPSRRRLDEFLAKWPNANVVSLNDDRDRKATHHLHAYCREDYGLADLSNVREIIVPYAGSQIANAVAFPSREIEDALGSGYLDHAVPMAIAYAMLRGASVIVLCGCDYGVGKECIPCTMWWLGVAFQAGVETVVPSESDLFRGMMDMRVFGNNLR